MEESARPVQSVSRVGVTTPPTVECSVAHRLLAIGVFR
eukprot:COSAG02_NODE_17111_length_1027_cov_6.450431_2_plen_37_part_01